MATCTFCEYNVFCKGWDGHLCCVICLAQLDPAQVTPELARLKRPPPMLPRQDPIDSFIITPCCPQRSPKTETDDETDVSPKCTACQHLLDIERETNLANRKRKRKKRHRKEPALPVSKRSLEKIKKVDEQKTWQEIFTQDSTLMEDPCNIVQTTADGGRSRGVCTARNFVKDEFVVEYYGEIVDLRTAKQLEEVYGVPESGGCYMFYFRYKDEQLCMDATEESGRLGRLVNHSRRRPNLKACLLEDLNGEPRLIFSALRDVASGEELLVDYGDRDRTRVQANPWLKNS